MQEVLYSNIVYPLKNVIEKLDQYQYLGNCLLQPNINPKLLSIDCHWVRGGVGGQLTIVCVEEQSVYQCK